ncbi:MAG TPA: tRNA (adenosine(37)-N6)-dimethylallyltransferase MiaA [Bryobacteraceae bacterium]|nr:tRNA (adenosine(37)-N6)-dimethylallyltransferase MiaA [Bryobacteraceae bacterium]
MSLRPLIAIVGPTGSGKSDLSLRICEEFGGEVVNCDSLQIYRHFDIGTAKVPVSERRGIRHHLLDIADPDQVFTAGEFAARARPLLEEISRRALPVVVGGTGFYLRALLDGLFPAPKRDDALRDRLARRERRRSGSLYRLLRRFDPGAAGSIHANDLPKLTRALEVYLLTRRPITDWFATGRDALEGFRPVKIGLDPPRFALYERLDARCERMFAEGLLEEAQRILDLGWPASAKPFEAHGYRQSLRILRGEQSRTEALAEAQRNTRRYAKRQLTWFRKEPDVNWLRGFGDQPCVQEAAVSLLGRLLPAKS